MLSLVIPSRTAALAPGMEVKRILPFRQRRMVGPFIFLDHAGPVETRVGPDMDVKPHPHIGLSTVSYLFGGQVTHRDSLGVEQIIKPGEVNWMTAGSGIAHSERFEDPNTLAGSELEMIQTWVALPDEHEETNPAFTNYQPHQLPVTEENGLWMRLIAGEAYGWKSEVATHSPLFYLHAELEPGARFWLPKGYSERAVYIASGNLALNSHYYPAGQMLVFTAGVDPVMVAREKTTLMVMGGEPVGDRYIWWNFVSSRSERIEQAKMDWKAGKIILPPNDNQEFIPLPENNTKPAGGPPPEALS